MSAIVVIGDIMMDVFLLPELKIPEQESGLLLKTGGSAANTAAWLAYLGDDVTLVGAIGNDPAGRAVADELRRHRVLTRLSVHGERPTGAVLVALDAEREYVMRSSRGANIYLSVDDVNAIPPDRTFANVHLTAYSLLSPCGLNLLHAAAQLARARGARLSVDISSQSAIRSIGRELLLESLINVETSILFANSGEVQALTGEESVSEGVKQLAVTFPLVFVKHGARGAEWTHRGDTRRSSAMEVAVVDTTGAGDAFAAGALSSLHMGGIPGDACVAGNSAASTAIQLYGGMPPQTS